MVSEAFKQNIKEYGREINAKFVFDDMEFSGTDIITAERIFDADFMMTTMQEVNGELNGRYNLKDKSFTFLFGVKPKLETTNQIDKNFSGLEIVGDDLVQTMVVEPNKIYNLRLDVLNTSHKPMTINQFTIPAGGQDFIEDTIVAGGGQTTWELKFTGESLHFVIHDPHFEVDNRFLEHEYINLGTFNVVEHERKVNAQGGGTTTFKAFDNMIKTHEIYSRGNLGITFPLSVGDLVVAIATYTDLTIETAGANLNKVIADDKWTGQEDVTYRNILDEIAQATGSGLTVYNNELRMKVSTSLDSEEINEDDIFSLKLKEEFGPVNVISFKDTDKKTDYKYPSNYAGIPKKDKYELVVEDNQIVKKDYAANLFSEVSAVVYYPFEAETQGFGYLNPLDIVSVVDLDGVAHKSVIMHSTLKIDSDVKETFKALPPILYKDENKVVKPEDRKFNRTQTKVNELSNLNIATMSAKEDVWETIGKLEERIIELERLTEQKEGKH